MVGFCVHGHICVLGPKELTGVLGTLLFHAKIHHPRNVIKTPHTNTNKQHTHTCTCIHTFNTYTCTHMYSTYTHTYTHTHTCTHMYNTHINTHAARKQTHADHVLYPSLCMHAEG